ncbi:MAG: RNA methyltransferase [Methanosarcina sp.]
MSLEIRIVLVEPLYQGNIGSVARAMKNFGCTDLVLVNPCELEGQARAMASHARDVLEGAKIVASLEEAVKGANLRIGTTGVGSLKTGEHIRLPLYTPEELKEKLKDCSGTVAILFGREDSGFRNDELKSFDMLITIPTSDVYPIMNLSHAVAVTLYELSELEGGNSPLADGFDLELLYEHLEEFLEEIEYPAHKKDKTFLMLRRIFGRAGLTPREVQTLRGLIRKTERKMGSVRKELKTSKIEESKNEKIEIGESIEKFILE